MNKRRVSLFLQKGIIVMLLLLCNNIIAISQQKVVTGLVTDEKEEPLIGVSIFEKGTTNGTITDVNGNYNLTIPNDETTIVFSFIGFDKEEVNVDGRSVINMKLKPSSISLDELVVVGYGVQKKVSVVGAVGSVKGDDLVRSKASTTATALVGKVAGITNRQTSGVPGSSTSLQIRNLGTPLYVIDGVMKDEGTFNNIDINDIESISILKDGAAAIYGVKASNGVVLVTTKRGKKGQDNVVKVNAFYAMQNLTYYPKGADAYTLMKGMAQAEMNDLGYTNITAEELEKYKTGYYNPETGEDYRSFDWYDYTVQKNAPQKYINVSTSGGGEKASYYISYSNMDQDAIFREFNFNRRNIQINSDVELSKAFSTAISINARIEKRTNPALQANNDYTRMQWSLLFMNPTKRPYVNDNPDYPAYYPINTDYNPAVATKEQAGYSNDTWRVFQGNWDLNYKAPIEGLNAKFTYSYYIADNKLDNFRKQYTLYDPTITDEYVPVYQNEDQYFRKRNRYIEENMMRLTIDYSKTLGAHTFGAIIAAEASERIDRTWQNDKNKIEHNYDDWFNQNDLEDLNYIGDYYWEGATAGVIGRLNYSFREKYLFEVSSRLDGSSKWAPDKRWGWFPSVSGGWRVSEEPFIANSFLGNIISNFKIRASYGEMGDEAMNASQYDYFDYLAGFEFGQNGAYIAETPFGAGTAGTAMQEVYYKDMPKSNVTWIRTSISNVGVDLGFLRNRLSLELDGFIRERKGLLGMRHDLNNDFPKEVGYGMQVENLNSDRHMGFDGFVKWQSKVNELNYNIGVNFTFARKMDYQLYGAAFRNSWDEYRNSTDKRWAGLNWAYEVVGRFESQEEIDEYPIYVGGALDTQKYLKPGDFKYKDINGDGVIDQFDTRPVGYAVGNNGQQLLPILTGGINLGFEWRGIDFGADFSAGAMYSYFQDYEVKWPFQSRYGSTPAYLLNDAWQLADPMDPESGWIEGRYPPIHGFGFHHANSTSYAQSDFWLHRIKYLRLRNIELGYSLPKSLLSKINISSCRFYVNGNNLFSWDNLHHLGLDPEMDERNGMGYPQHKIVSFGTNISF